MNDDGVEQAAILLLSLGEEEAAEVFKYLAPKEVQKLGAAMTRLDAVTRERVAGVLDRFDETAAGQTSLGGDAKDYIRGVLTRALGADKATFILERILQGGDTSGIESLKWMDPASVAELLKGEHPQIIASVLVHLERDHAADILGRFTGALRNDVVLRVATLDGIQPVALKELNDVLSKVLAGGDNNIKKSALGGVRAAAEMLNFLGNAAETEVLEAVRGHDAELAQKVLDEMFVFDDLAGLDDKAVQLVLREVQSEALVVALKGASEAIREKVFANMSQRAGEMLRDDLESKGPVKVSEVEAQQKEILKIVRRLAEAGEISLGAKGEEQYV
jgi:flagellar motor switch protein FliG